MDISIVICTYNRSHGLDRVLGQLAEQKLPSELAWEILVVDNNSTDDTPEIVGRFAQQHPDLDLRYVFEPSQGLSFARNRAVREAKGEIVAFTDDDVFIDTGWVGAIAEVLPREEFMGFGGKVIPQVPPDAPPWLVSKGRFALNRGGVIVSHNPGDVQREYTGKDPRPVGANLFFRRTAFERFGLFRTDLGKSGDAVFFGEDVEFTARLEAGGARLLYVPTAVVYHPVDSARLTKRVFRQYYYQIGRARARLSRYPSHAVKYQGIPRHLFRKLAVRVGEAAVAIAMLRRERWFYYELEIRSLLGELIGCYGLRSHGTRNRSHI